MPQEPLGTARSSSVLIATDFSDSSQEATLHGFKTASLWGSAPHVAHVCKRVNDLLSIEHRREQLLLTPERGSALLAEHVDRLLQHYRQAHGEPSFGVAVSHVLVGDAAESVVQLARDLKSALIVVGTSKNLGTKRWLMGSTAERVVRMAECPVMVFRPRQLNPEETIEPACPACVEVRRQSNGQQIWCAQHQRDHERRHTYHYRDKNARARENLPLLFPMQASRY